MLTFLYSLSKMLLRIETENRSVRLIKLPYRHWQNLITGEDTTCSTTGGCMFCEILL